MRFASLLIVPIIALTGLGPAALVNAAAPASTAAPANSCAVFVVKPTPASRAADAARVRSADRNQKIDASGIGTVMVEGPWRLVWATPKNAERGVYFFRRTKNGGYRLATTWGGILAPDERQDGITWASQIKGGGPSPKLAACFADTVIAGE